MHHIHHTDAIVLGGIPIEESSRFLILLTRDFGCIRAVAKSVREEKSKLRYGLQELSFSRIALVRGRDVWRLTGAQELESFYHRVRTERERVAVLLEFRKLLIRLLQGEAPDNTLFDEIHETIRAIATTPLYAVEDAARHGTARVLYLLGYVAKNTTLLEALFEEVGKEKNKEVMSETTQPYTLSDAQRKTLDALLAHALHASQL